MSDLDNSQASRSTPGDKYVTSVKSIQYNYAWEINNFSVWCALVTEAQYSPEFPSGPDEPVQWKLKFEPKSSEDDSCCSLFLELVVPVLEENDRFDAVCEISLEDSSGNTIVTKSLKSENGWNAGWGWFDLIEYEALLEAVLPEDQLVILCKISANTLIVNQTIKQNVRKQPKLLPSSLGKDLKTLIDDSKFGDVAVLIDGQRFLAHKCILTARSPVFAAMFEHQLQENIKSCVAINDVEPEVFKELLRYIYTDELTSLDTMAHKLYAAADKYVIPTLKSLCRVHILEKLGGETAAETLVLAEMHSDQEMKKRVLEFLSETMTIEVIESEGWKCMVQTHPYLVDETVRALLEVRKPAVRD